MVSLQPLIQEFNHIYSLVTRMEDTVDKIDVLEPFIKKILETAGREELLLASPLGPECRLSDYETEGNSWGEVIQDFIEHFFSDTPANEDDGLLEWLEPAWVAYEDFPDSLEETGLTLYFSDCPNRKILVRLGIVKGRIKYTQQSCKTNKDGALVNLCQETQWRSLKGIMDADFWMNLIAILLTKPEVWEYNDKYPLLLKKITYATPTGYQLIEWPTKVSYQLTKTNDDYIFEVNV